MRSKPRIIKQSMKRSDGSLSYREYQQIRLLGEGSFAKCYEVKRLDDQKHLALKIIDKNMLKNNHQKQRIISQISIHRVLKHNNIVLLERIFQSQQYIYMVLELCTNKTFQDLLNSRLKLTVPETQYYIYQLISALSYIHTHNVIHRDLKFANLFLNQNLTLKIGDFGLGAKLLFPGDKRHSSCGTPNYVAPEVILPSMKVNKCVSGHSYQVDVWAIGIILYGSLVGKLPFYENTTNQVCEKIINLDYTFPKSFNNQSAKDLIRNILVVDPSKRFTLQQILNHPFMNPIQGIPKQIPLQSLIKKPKLIQYQTNEYTEVIKESAKTASAVCSIRQNLRNNNIEEIIQQSGFIGISSKQLKIRGLVHSSSFTSLQQSLEKLGRIKKSTSIQTFKQKAQLQELAAKQQQEIQLKGKLFYQSQLIYVVSLQKDTIWTYQLSDGLIGTYQTSNNYRILFNKTQDYYIQILDHKYSSQIYSNMIQQKPNVLKRLKYLNTLASKSNIKCSSSLNKIYVQKAYQIKFQNLVFFKLSNGISQLYSIQSKISLLISNKYVYLVQINQKEQKVMVKELISNCFYSSNKNIRLMYPKAKKIMQKIAKNKTNVSNIINH